MWGKYLKSLQHLILIFCVLFCSKAHAIGPIDGEAGLNYWVTDVDNIDSTTLEAPPLSGFGELWFNQKIGVRASLNRVKEENVNMASDEQISVDLKYRVASLTDNTFLALGLGWEQNRFGSEGTLSGSRIVAETRIGLLGVFTIYGEAAWAPNMGDLGLRQEVSAIGVETGLVLDPLPFFSLRTAWRYHITDFNGSITGTSTREASYGVIIGIGIHW